jgi:hypothetical protein
LVDFFTQVLRKTDRYSQKGPITLSKSTFVLRALKILGLDEMLKLSQVLHVKQVPLKKAAGEDLVVWDDAPVMAPRQQESTEAKVLSFPKKTIQDLAPLREENLEKEDDKERPNFLTSDLVLWQREIAKSSGENVHKLDAFKGYKKSTEMYVVKTPTPEGKDKIRFASTNGVLVNKKQA